MKEMQTIRIKKIDRKINGGCRAGRDIPDFRRLTRRYLHAKNRFLSSQRPKKKDVEDQRRKKKKEYFSGLTERRHIRAEK